MCLRLCIPVSISVFLSIGALTWMDLLLLTTSMWLTLIVVFILVLSPLIWSILLGIVWNRCLLAMNIVHTADSRSHLAGSFSVRDCRRRCGWDWSLMLLALVTLWYVLCC